jgi:hypothetical protein
LKPYVHLILAAVAVPINLTADQTFVWKGDDPRFSGWFSISDADYERRQFDMITAARYAFEDARNPAANVVLTDPRGFHPCNVHGRLTADGQRMRHDIDPANPNVSFWVAVWRYPGIDVGMYGYNDGGPLERFEYANYEQGVIAKAIGTWTLVPEPDVGTLILLGIGAFWRFRRLER